MARLRVYLDTSVFSALLDDDAPERRTLTETFWNQRANYEVSTSQVAEKELGNTPDASLRHRLLELLTDLHVLPVTGEIDALANRYIAADIFTIRSLDDALHVASATLTSQNVLLSWNFRHLVKRSRRAAIDAVNLSLSLPTIEILSPPEL